MPQIVIRANDAWAARQLRELAAEHRWLLRESRTPAEALTLARESRLAVIVLEVDPTAEDASVFEALAEAQRVCPGIPIVALSDTKMPDADRVAWTAVLLDLGARYVLFPPLAKPVLEDAVSGLMAATIRRLLPEAAAS